MTRTREPKETRVEELRRKLAEEILMGALPPGLRLGEAALAERFGMSRTPVREALKVLATTGLVTFRPKCGAQVSIPTQETLAQLFEAMAEMEATCARISARKMTAQERRQLVSVHDRARLAVERAELSAYIKANSELHSLIYAGTHNDILVAATQSIRQRVQPFRRVQLGQPGRLEESSAEHDAIVSAILRNDEEAAARAMRAHIDSASMQSAGVIALRGGSVPLKKRQMGQPPSFAPPPEGEVLP